MPKYRTDTYIVDVLARWAAALKFEDLSDQAIAAAKLFWLDSIGCALGGAASEDARILLKHYQAMNPSGDGPCTVFTTDWKTNPVDAAFLNSHMVRALDFNDIYWQADPAHPSDLICGPLALCEMLGKSGRDLILATVLLYELQCRFAEIGRPGIREYGWHHATLSGFSAPIGAGRVLGLSPDQISNAVGISASRTGTLGAVTAGELSMMKNTVDPWASRVGVESALLAQQGFTGPGHIIDGKEGLFHVFSHSSTSRGVCGFDADGLIHELPTSPGHPMRIERCGMKTVPVEALMHAPLSALGVLRDTHEIPIDQVVEIRVEVIARAADILGDPAKYRPRTRETADHSLPYAIAVYLVDGVLGPAQFENGRIADESLRPIMDLVRVVPNDDFESRFPESQPSRVTITLADGRRCVAEVEYPKGDPRNPMSVDELEAKLHMLGDERVSDQDCQQLCGFISTLDQSDSVSPLCNMLMFN
jgi:2-methylcitrate dehydratase